MGKRKIGEIYNRPIIEGDINLKTSSEIHKSELSVPQSGGGGSEEGSGADMLYLDLSTLSPEGTSIIVQFATDAVYSPAFSDTLLYGPAAPTAILAQNYPEKVKRLSFNRTQPFFWPGTEFSTCKNIGEVLELMELSPETASDLFITKEQFYNLEA